MQIGFNLPNSGPLSGVADMTRIATEGEAMGFDYLTLTDHVVLPNTRVPGYPYSESGQFYEDAPLERVVGQMQRVVQADPRHGYARYVLAGALLRQGTEPDTALQHLSQAVQQDDLLVDLAADSLMLARAHIFLEARYHVIRIHVDGVVHLHLQNQVGAALEIKPEVNALRDSRHHSFSGPA